MILLFQSYRKQQILQNEDFHILFFKPNMSYLKKKN